MFGEPRDDARASTIYNSVIRTPQLVLIGATLLASWLGMQAVHELGHVLAAFATGAKVERVELSPVSFSRTDLGVNPNPLVVAWGGPILGSVVPALLWLAWRRLSLPFVHLPKFFAGFCLVANGTYLGVAPVAVAGDSAVLLQHGAYLWQLAGFGTIAVVAGLRMWHREGVHFGLGAARGHIERVAASG